MINRREFTKIILSQILSIGLSFLFIQYVFFPKEAKLRPNFQKTLYDSPKKVAETFHKSTQTISNKISDIANLATGIKKVALPPPWIIPTPHTLPDSTTYRPGIGGGIYNPNPPTTDNRLPTTDSSQPTTYHPQPTTRNPQPSTHHPPPTTYNPQPTTYNPPPTQPPPPAATSVPPIPSPIPPGGSLTSTEQEVVDIINSRRRDVGLSALSVNLQLTTAARKHSKDIGQNGICGHTGSDGSSPFQRAQNVGYNNLYGETVACGYNTASQVVNGWWSSPGHHAILTNSNIKVIGLGTWSGTKRVTAMVGY